MTLSDYYEYGSTTCAITTPSGEIRFNTYAMDYLLSSSQERQCTCTHELGHALGLAHNQSGDVMYYANNGQTVLSDNDKISYDVSYFR